ncbi:ankyrin repeat-containing domain protein, partial [Leptodontidium sp. 2 PMI_412]
QLLLESGADTEAIDIDGRSALFNAVLSNQLVMVQLLVEGKSDLEFKEGSTLETALHKAVWSAAASDVAKLVDLPPKQKIFTDDHPQRTQISAVTRDKAFEIIKYLLQQGADIETRNVLGETPLFDATSYGSAATVSLLVEHGANTKVYDLDSVTPLHISAEQGLLGLANLLLDSGAVLEARDSCGQTAIHVAAKHGHHLLVRRLLERGACIHALNSRSMSALHVAAQAKAQRSPEIIQLLLENGSNVEALDSRGRTAYIVAAEKGNRRNFEEFLKIRRKSVPESISEGSIPFHRAINVPEDSLPSFIDINAKDINGRTCFFVASINNNASLMKTLAEKGACVDAPDSEGQTPLHFVANYSYGGERIVRMLLELGADVNARNCSGEVPLHIAAVQGNYQMSELLVDASADTYIKDDSGKTAVEAAIQAKGQCHFCSDPHNNHDLCHDGIIKLLKVGYRRLSMDSRFQIE